MADNSVIDEIKDRLDVLTVVGRYVPLKKSGSSYKGLCPFHSEKTPSFHVFPQTNTWKCFGCGAGGDIFTFVEKKENLPFPDVLRMLAKEAGVQLQEARPEVRDARQRLRDLHTQAASYFQSQLLVSKEGQTARDYLARRQVNQETIEQFQLGYARDGWEHLIAHLKSKGFTLEEMLQGGMVIQRETGGAYDRFRHRLIIPIHDAQGRVIAFGGRILGEGEPKYLNSPQTSLFDKSQVIFALDLAKRTIRSRDQVVLVEGYMDVISAHQQGFKNVVAAMGTSITPQQIKILSRYSRNFVFAMDADAAGARASWRGVQIVQETLSARGLLTPSAKGFRTEKRMLADVSIAIMPEGKDPDDVLREDAASWQQLIENAIPVVDYTLQHAAQTLDLTSASGKSQFVQEVLPTLSKIGDAIQRRHYIGKVAAMVKVRENDVEEALTAFERSQRRHATTGRKKTAPPTTSPDSAPPPADVRVGSDEEPPLWSSSPASEPSSPASTAKTPKKVAVIGPEEHFLSVILLYHQTLLPWLDEELGQLEVDPLYTEDFADVRNRMIFELLDDFRFENPEGDLLAFVDEQEAHLREHFHFLWQYATRFEASKPKYIQQHHLQREIVTSLLRLRLSHVREMQHNFYQSQDETPDPDELRLMSKLSQQRNKLEKAITHYSQAARWTNNNRSSYGFK